MSRGGAKLSGVGLKQEAPALEQMLSISDTESHAE